LGLIALRRGAWADAVLLFERGAEAPDAPAAVFHNLAYARERMHRLDAADDALSACAVVTASGGAAGNRGASAAASADPRTLVSAAMLAVLRGAFETVDVRLAEARAAWGARQPNAVWYHVAALAAALRGDLHGATAVLEEGIALYPHAVPLHNNLAVIQERAGLHESAARTLEHALLEHGSDPTLHKNLGDFHYRAQRYDDALVAFERTARLAPRHGADVFLKLGNIHYRRGATHEARTAWGKALELEPDHRIVRANLDVLLRAEQAMTADAAAAIAAVSA
jgi:Flp pilus assembly protein TadD